MTTAIETAYNKAHDAIFRQNELSYDNVCDLLIDLANIIADSETDESTWSIGEFNEACLADLITGAYWHFTEWHGGQWSKGYAALSALGSVFSPGMSNGPEPETGEHSTYEMLESIAA